MKKSWPFLFLVLFSALIIYWEIKPPDNNQRILYYDDEQSNLGLDECLVNSGLLDSAWNIVNPESVELGAPAKITLTIIPENKSIEKNRNICLNSSIAVELTAVDALIEPGEKIFTDFNPNQATHISWEVTTFSEDLDAQMWIYAVTNNKDGQINSTPLFSVPINIDIVSFLGIQPRIVRIAMLSIQIVLSIILIIKNQKKLRMI